MVAFCFIFGSILFLFCFVVVPYMIAAFVGDTVAFLLMLFVIEFKFGFLFHYCCIFIVVIFLYVLLLLLLLLLPLLSCTIYICCGCGCCWWWWCCYYAVPRYWSNLFWSILVEFKFQLFTEVIKFGMRLLTSTQLMTETLKNVLESWIWNSDCIGPGPGVELIYLLYLCAYY